MFALAVDQGDSEVNHKTNYQFFPQGSDKIHKYRLLQDRVENQ
jgi:hypothetical protein